jgi:hypothetical protein
MLILSIEYSLLRECHLCKGIVVDQARVETIMEWPASMNFPEVSNFMGLAGYYQRFVKGFSKIANPIMKLSKKKKKLFGPKNAWRNFGGSRIY